MQWKFDKLVKGARDAICSKGYGPKAVEDILRHLMNKAYIMGKEEPVVDNSIPITDLTYIPEVFRTIKGRWAEGVSN
jgi:hypothetical protein